jgi:hypothetical protein
VGFENTIQSSKTFRTLHRCATVFVVKIFKVENLKKTCWKLPGDKLGCKDISSNSNTYCATSRKVATMALGSIQPLTEMSTRNLPGGKGRPTRKADNLVAICESVV